MENKKTDRAAIMFLLSRYARPVWKQIILLVFLTFAANFFLMLKPAVVSGIVNIMLTTKGDKAAPTESLVTDVEKGPKKIFDLNKLGDKVKKVIVSLSNNPSGDFWSSIKIILGLLLVVSFLAALSNYLALMLGRWICAKTTQDISMDLSRHILSLNLGFFHRQKSGEIISRFTQDIKSTAYGLGPLLQCIIKNSLSIVLYSIYLFSTSIWMTLGAIGMIILQFGLTHIIKRPIRRTVRNYYSRLADLTTTVQEMLTSIRVIKSFGAEDYELKKLQRDTGLFRKADFEEGSIRQLEPNARDFLDSFAIIGIFLIASVQFMSGSLSIQGFLLFVYVGQLLIAPINSLAVNITWLQGLLASYDRLDEIFSEKPKVIEGKLIKDNFSNDIALNNVSFSYGTVKVINKLSLTLKKGEILALVGPSGAGKSTLTDLILRFYDPQEGEILIDGINLRQLKVSSYRRIFGVVPQESLLFNDTVANNIIYGRKNISKEEMLEAAKIANAHDFIQELPNGYDTYVGDRGVRLSGGQRQRIAIARAIVSRPEILIFDEATSSLDTESERQVQLAIDRVLEKSTAIAIAHRLSTVLHADKIVVLNKGNLEAVGTHNELLEKSQMYRKLYELQFRASGGHL